jgi:hypothetical protein
MPPHNLNVAILTPTAWAESSELGPEQLDCVTAVALKILDRKCKMPSDEQEAMLAIYDLLHPAPAKHFDDEVHQVIDSALRQEMIDPVTAEAIHQLRLKAEALIPKPVMKAFKARLREELFDQ